MEPRQISIGDHIEGYGKVLSVAYKKPTPMTSWITELESNGILADDIAKFYLTCELIPDTLDYLKRTKIDDKFNYVIKGYNPDKSAKETENIKLIETDNGFFDHKNLVETKEGKFFLWHEPYHVKHGKTDYFGEEYEINMFVKPEDIYDDFGAFLVEPDEGFLNEIKAFYNICK